MSDTKISFSPADRVRAYRVWRKNVIERSSRCEDESSIERSIQLTIELEAAEAQKIPCRIINAFLI